MANESCGPDTQDRLTDLAHLSAGIGHHVINAFSAIVSNAEILRLSPQMADSVDPLAVAEVIVKSAIEASTVARRLIDFTRPVTTINYHPTLLHEVLGRIADEQRMSTRPGVEWITDLAPVPPVLANAQQLSAMLDHLITNAYESIPLSGGRIRLGTGIDPRGWVVIELSDTGCGMTPEVHQHAVEPFFTTKPGRFGVGLTIANGIWRRHRGTLGIQTRPSEGTCIRMYIEPEGGET
ncbi:MAG: ATP-binding protein [Isosphaeraceae bacterium]